MMCETNLNGQRCAKASNEGLGLLSNHCKLCWRKLKMRLAVGALILPWMASLYNLGNSAWCYLNKMAMQASERT